jgi:cobalt/nickel transport protein
MKTKIIAAFAMIVAGATTASAHFQLLYTPEVNLARAADVTMKMVFWHPLENGPMMDMGKPQAVYYRHKGKNVDLTEEVSEVSFHGPINDAVAFEVTTPVRRLGDYIFVIEPAPYLEESEGIYIQQFTKSYLNRGGVPTDWMEPVGLPAEILPLNKPTNVMVGSSFTGRVLSDGKPVGNAEIEIEYMAAELDPQNNATFPPSVSPVPGGSIVALSDSDGYFTFGIPRAGFWGFAALGVGAKKTHNDKSLSQDAVIWIRAFDFE